MNNLQNLNLRLTDNKGNNHKKANVGNYLYLRGASRIMYRAREENPPLPIYQQRLPVVAHIAEAHLKTHE